MCVHVHVCVRLCVCTCACVCVRNRQLELCSTYSTHTLLVCTCPCSLYVHGVLFLHIEVGNRLSEVPHHSGAPVPSQKSTCHGTKESLKAQTSTQQDENALAGNYAITCMHNVPIYANPCMFMYRNYHASNYS